MSTQILPDAATHGPLRSVEQVLATISAIVDRSGLAAPRRLSFDEPRPGEPLAVLSLSWPSVEDMRPWMQVFSIDAHREGATTVTGDYAGWSLLLTAPNDVVIPVITGTPAEVAAQLGQHFGADCTCDGEIVHQTGCPAEHGPIPYMPVPMPTGAQANAAECARLNGDEPVVHLIIRIDDYACGQGPAGSLGSWSSRRAADVTCPDCAATLPVTPVLADRSERSVPEHVDRIPLRVVDITTDDPDLTDVGRGDAEVARMVAPQTSFAEALPRLRAQRDNKTFAQIVSEVQS